ncbi:aminotransferase class I/II-fold pyridoxal phosphate-dependent enzyme [Litoribacter ruber]|uniref:pyridoxal phosphate-dependent aminotransferase n=1 Tax=Litoribacter ruber TaxID=702568 RepID=UPI001BDA1FFB|nr:aminotransferase class I/II-fold pyridoxal phosphate-dependent enzyme [Litoribacter ruber]MBT0811349.1 aminotransferase class I/II-fold pyridoxal phosphate-dependent enzyme [Litoribacter ruber]
MKKYSKRLQNVQEYYFSSKLKEVKQLIAQGQPIIEMGIGSPDLPPHPSIIKALQDSAGQECSHGYQSYQGSPELRTAFAEFYQRQYGVSFTPENILPLMGSKEGILHISMAFLDEDDQVLIPNPGYPTYSAVTKLVKAHPVFYNLKEEDNWQPDFEALQQQDLSKVKLMWVNYPHMPTGALASESLFEKLVAFGQNHNILIVHDNPYSFILNPEPKSIFSIEGAAESVLELNSLSKTFNIPGWRVGMMAGKKEFLQAILQVKSNMDSGMFLGIQKGAIAALGLNKEWFDGLNSAYQSRRTLVWKLAESLGLTFHRQTAGMFVWAKLPDGMDDLEFADSLMQEKQIFVAPGSIFGSGGKGYIRFSLCTSEDRILEAIRRCSS